MAGVSVLQALDKAKLYWEAKGQSSRMMSIRAQSCASALGYNAARKRLVTDLGPGDGTTILTHLHRKQLSKGSIASYYAAFRRAVELSGGSCRDWPKPGTPPRRCREPLSEVDLRRLSKALEGWTEGGETGGWETHGLLQLLWGTGLRVDVEALRSDALEWRPESRTLKVTGKGGHERVIPVERPETIALLNDPERLKAMRGISYSWHLKKWMDRVDKLGIASLKPTPHAVRHYYATRAYAKSGRNLKVVQELLGHADISTTARYLGVDVETMRSAVT